MERRAWLAEEFERNRRHLRAVSYRMLGSLSEAEDAVQEAWLRLDRSDPGSQADLRPWLTTVVGRICLDMLRARRTRREHHPGPWLPEPIVGNEAEVESAIEPAFGGAIDRVVGAGGAETGAPEQEAILAESLGLALLVVLETLTPAERVAFVLHDVFAVPFEDIAALVGRTSAATRQLASRGRRRVRSAGVAPDADLAVQRQVVDAFLAAARSGDFEALVAVLDPDVILRTDVGDRPHLARPAAIGREAVVGEIRRTGRRLAGHARPALVNGGAGAVVGPPGRPWAIVGFSVRAGRIRSIDIVADPAKLRGKG